MDYTIFYFFGAAAGLLIFFYFISPQLKLINYRSNIRRSIIFFGMMSYLTYDFYLKEKYSFIVIVALGSIGFIYFILNGKKNPRNTGFYYIYHSISTLLKINHNQLVRFLFFEIIVIRFFKQLMNSVFSKMLMFIICNIS